MTNSKTFKKTLSFILVYMIFSLTIFIGFFALNFYLGKGTKIAETLPKSKNLDYQEVDWEGLNKIQGYGLLVDSDGNILKSFNKDLSGRIDLFQILGYSNYENTDTSLFSYDTSTGNKLLLFFPKTNVSLNPTININSVIPGGNLTVALLALTFLGIYILGTYLLIRRLGRFFQAEQKRAYKEELEEKDRLFRGLAHDMKTPLTAIIGYNQALQDGLIPKDQERAYYEKIQKSAYTLKSRLDGLMNFASLGSKKSYELRRGDILETTRRYIGDTYSYFSDAGVLINIDFDDQESFYQDFDPDLVDRLLQNILQNTIDHQEKPVQINISFKDKTLFIKDTGKEIPKDMWETIFEPMVTGEDSRTGETNRGLGLANVKRICQIHNWQVSYNENGFQIKFS